MKYIYWICIGIKHRVETSIIRILIIAISEYIFKLMRVITEILEIILFEFLNCKKKKERLRRKLVNSWIEVNIWNSVYITEMKIRRMVGHWRR